VLAHFGFGITPRRVLALCRDLGAVRDADPAIRPEIEAVPYRLGYAEV
jgi:hypothetical protein